MDRAALQAKIDKSHVCRLKIHRWMKSKEAEGNAASAKGRRTVSLLMPKNDRWLGVELHTYGPRDHRVVKVHADSVAEGLLELNDRVLTINGQRTLGLDHNQVGWLRLTVPGAQCS